jgi:hypothetical protein
MAIQVGRRIIFDKTNGKVLIDLGEMQGDVLPREEVGSLDFIDLPYGQDSDKFMRVKTYHIDTTTKTVIFDELHPIVETEEERLRREKEELENRLLLQANKEVGGIL